MHKISLGLFLFTKNKIMIYKFEESGVAETTLELIIDELEDE